MPSVRRSTSTVTVPPPARVLESVVDKIADSLRQQQRIACHRHRSGVTPRQVDVFQLRRRQIQLDRLRRKLCRVEVHKTRTAHAGVNLRKTQQRIEYADDTIDIGDRGINLRERFMRRRAS
jgi:hypothetical protein